MPKKSNFSSATVSFEDFEKALSATPASDLSTEELLEIDQAQETAALKKHRELKKAYQRRKRAT